MVLLSICGGVTTIWGVVKVYREARKPTEERNEKLQDLDDRIQDNEEVLEEISDAMPLLLRSITLIIDHMVSGDGKEDLEECQQEIKLYLIDQVGRRHDRHESRRTRRGH